MGSEYKIIEIVKKLEALTEEIRGLLPDADLLNQKIIDKIESIDKKEQEGT